MENNEIKNGEVRVAIISEELLWKDCKRLLPFGIVWPFTEYSLTHSKLLIKTGFLNTREDEIRLYRIKDISCTQSIMERMANTGTLHVYSIDASVPAVQLKHIKNAKIIMDVLSQAVEESRKEHGVKASELMGDVLNEN